MKAVLQRVSEASVTVDKEITGQVKNGLLVLAGFEDADTEEDLKWMAGKVTQLRIFNDDAGVMNRSLLDIGGELLVISQFTLHASTRKGNRPSYQKAAKGNVAEPLYQLFLQMLQGITGKPVQAGIFGADMKVRLLNDGPVTIIIDSKNPE